MTKSMPYIIGTVLLLTIIILTSIFIFKKQDEFTFVYTNNQSQTEIPIITIPVYIDNNFSLSEKEKIKENVKTWNIVLNKNIELYIKSDSFDSNIDNVIEVIKNNSFVFVKLTQEDKPIIIRNDQMVLAYTDKIGGNIVYVFPEIIKENYFSGVILHEMGHLFGARHVTDNMSLMNPKFTTFNTICIDKITSDMVAEYYNINNKYLNYCEIISK